jgi:hypothetical protein
MRVPAVQQAVLKVLNKGETLMLHLAWRFQALV